MDNYKMAKKIKAIANELFDSSEKKMLALVRSGEVTQSELDSAIDGWDSTTATFKSLTIAFNLAKNHPEVSFPSHVLPQLQQVGITSRKRYLEILPHFVKVVKALDSKGIPFIFLKGGAMRVYRPDIPRWSADIDVLVPEERYEEVLAEVKQMGYFLHLSPHSAGIRDLENGQDFVDIHKYVSMDTGKERNLNEPLVSRSVVLPFSSYQVRVPCPEDMVFISLVNFCKNIAHIFHDNSNISIANLCFDLVFLDSRSSGLDWEIVRSDARITGSSEAVYLAIKILEEVIPDYFPKGFLVEDIDYKKVKRLLSRIVFSKDVLGPLREEIGVFNVSKAAERKVNPLRYLYLRTKYFFLKRYPAGGFKTKG